MNYAPPAIAATCFTTANDEHWGSDKVFMSLDKSNPDELITGNERVAQIQKKNTDEIVEWVEEPWRLTSSAHHPGRCWVYENLCLNLSVY